ncbi:MAG: bacillithiol biosynthesis deacetylase BshB1 [Bacteroidota bacterium]
MKVDILAIGVHPDDVELSCSGSLLKHIEMGKTVGLLDLTRGELGTRGNAEIRKKEADNSAEKMGALFRKNVEMADGFFNYSKENIIKIIKIIRWCQPEIVLANALDDRHPDHGRAAKLTADACYLSGLVKISTKNKIGELQKKWRPKALYHYIQDRNLTPDFVIDISPYFEKKMELILTFSSQFYLPENTAYKDELKTPISGKDFMDFMRAKGRSFGRSINVEYAEGFNKSRVFGVDDLFDLI